MIFQIMAIIILFVFYGTYMTKKMYQKKQGIQTDQLGKGKIGIVLFIEYLLKIMSFVIVGVDLLAIFLNVNSAPLTLRIIGIVFGIIGDTVFILAVLTMRDSWRAGVTFSEKTELITNGVFQYSRNPAFLGFYLMYISILMMFFSWWLLIITAFTIFVFHLQIVNVEEDFLISTFGDKYLAYKKRVYRYFGRRTYK